MRRAGKHKTLYVIIRKIRTQRGRALAPYRGRATAVCCFRLTLWAVQLNNGAAVTANVSGYSAATTCRHHLSDPIRLLLTTRQ